MRAAVFAALFVLPTVASAAECERAKVLVVLDRSSSMTYAIDGVAKWDIAVDALTAVVEEYADSIDVGLMMFPSAGECSPGTVQVEIAPGNAAAVEAALADPPPEAGNWTPMAQSLDVAASHEPLIGSLEPHVLVITDGWQWCDPYDPATRFTPVDSVARLAASGITTWVVGFGDGVDPLALNRMADAAGTALEGCDPTSEDVAGANCYWQADAAEELLEALEEIALEIAAEECNGIDDDCDGVVDEDACPDEGGDGDADSDGGEPDEVIFEGGTVLLPGAGTATGTGTDGDEDYVKHGCGCDVGGAPSLIAGLVLISVGALRRSRRRS